MINSLLYKNIGEYARIYASYPNIVDKSDPDNREKLILKNMRLAADIAVKYASKYSLDDEEADELIAAAMEGLCRAYDKYDTGKECFNGRQAKFSSVAYFWINAAVMSATKKMLDNKTKMCELFDEIPEGHQRDIEKYELLHEGVGETDLYLTRLRFGLEDGHPMTYREISRLTGFRQSLIKKCVKTCIDRMRENAERYGIRFGDVVSE